MAYKMAIPEPITIVFSKNEFTPAEIDRAIVSRYFNSKVDDFNSSGDCKFSIKLPEEVAYAYKENGWNVSINEAKRNEDGELFGYLPVFIKFGNSDHPVTIVQAKKKPNGKHRHVYINEKTIKDLQSMRFIDFRVSINPSYWERANGKYGIKAYLEEMVFECEPLKFENAFDWDDDDDDDGLPFSC